MTIILLFHITKHLRIFLIVDKMPFLLLQLPIAINEKAVFFFPLVKNKKNFVPFAEICPMYFQQARRVVDRKTIFKIKPADNFQIGKVFFNFRIHVIPYTGSEFRRTAVGKTINFHDTRNLINLFAVIHIIVAEQNSRFLFLSTLLCQLSCKPDYIIFDIYSAPAGYPANLTHTLWSCPLHI